MRDKQVMQTLAGFELLPVDYIAQINAILAHPGEGAAALQKSVTRLKQVWRSVTELPGVAYQPQFQV